MKEDTTIIPFHQPDSVSDPLTEIALEGARRMLAEALKAEADAFVAGFADETLPDGRRRVVRHGHGPERSIQTGTGALDVRRPKVRDPLPDRRLRSNLPRGGRRHPCRPESALHLEYPAEMGTAVAQSRCAAAGAVPARHFDRRLPG